MQTVIVTDPSPANSLNVHSSMLKTHYFSEPKLQFRYLYPLNIFFFLQKFYISAIGFWTFVNRSKKCDKKNVLKIAVNFVPVM